MKTLSQSLLISWLAAAVHGFSTLAFAEPPIANANLPARPLTQFTLAAGLEAAPFAFEPMLRNPTDMDIDERGRVWVTEGVNYRSTFQKWGILQPAGDRIVILEDTQGDGRANKQTVFYQDPSINAALGICVLGNKVIVSDSPNVFILTDTNGDGVADRRELLFTGMGGVDHDHGVHAFSFGPDGKLYFNMGNEGKGLFWPVRKDVPLHGKIEGVEMKPVVDLDGKEVVNRGAPYRMGMVFRCNPDGSDVETLAWNFRNTYEVAVDSFGTMWQSDNDDDGNQGVRVNYVMEFGNYGYADEMTGAGWSAGWDEARAKGAAEDLKIFYEWHQFDPGVVPDLLHTGAGAPAGIAVYEGKLLPEILRNQIINCDAGSRVVRAYPVQNDGAGYRATTQDVLTTSDTWFRPSDLCVAPDGSLYVADWNDAGVGGHYMVDQVPEKMTGRIYRVAPEGTQPSVPVLNLKTAEGCVQALQSPNNSTRYLAWTKLHAMQGRAERALLKLWNGHDARMRARALQLLARISGRERHYVEATLRDNNSDIRIVGLRIARELKLDVIPYVKELARDDSAQVRRECAIALRHNHSAEAPRLWAGLAAHYDGRDRWYLEALGIGADGQWESFLDAWLEQGCKQWNTAAGRELVWRSRSSKTAALLVKIIQDGNLNAEQCRHYFRSFDFINGPEKNAALRELLVMNSGALTDGSVTATNSIHAAIAFETLNRLKGISLDADPELRKVVLKLLDRTRGKPQFVELVRDFNVTDQDPALLQIAAANPASSMGVEALRMLLNHPDHALVKNELAGPNAINIAKALGNTGEGKIVPLLSAVVTNLDYGIAVRKQAVSSLAQVEAGAAALLGLARNQQLPPDLRLYAGSTLNGVRWENLKGEAAKILPMPQTQESQLLPPISELAKLRGDPAMGATIFRRDSVGCIKCHQIKGEGIDFGPNLSEIGTKLGKEAIYESILDPSAGIAFGYEAWRINFKNGDEAYGLLVSETADELAIKAVGGIVTRYNKSEITSRTKQKLSIMPAGLQRVMSQKELVDLVEYLSSLKKPSQ